MVATTEVRYENGTTGYGEDSAEETLERWVAHPGDIQRILNLEKELERVKERARKEQESEREVTPSTGNDGSGDSLPNTYHMDGEEVMTSASPTSLRIPPFGGTPCENLSSLFRRFDSGTVRSISPLSRWRRRNETEGDGYGFHDPRQPDWKGLGRVGRLSGGSLRVCAGFQGCSETGVSTVGSGGSV